MDILKNTKSPAESLIVLNGVVFLQDGGPGYRFKIRAKDVAAIDSQVKRRLEYLK